MDFRYLTTTKGIGGRIKQLPQDFVVEEKGFDYSTNVNFLPDKKVPEIDWKFVFENKPAGKPHLYLDLEKHNLSTAQAISQMSRFLQFSKKRFGYAGLKDKRSISSQRVSLYDPNLDRLSKFYFKDIKVYNPSWHSEKISIGDLKENHFKITIRQITSFTKPLLEKTIIECFQEIKKNGLLNYFGEQRFGVSREVTSEVGKHLIFKDYKQAVLVYLTKLSPFDSLEVKQARQDLLLNKDFKKWCSVFPLKDGFERTLLNHLSKHPDDYFGAFKTLSRPMQFLFVHAYQSFLFNEMINYRLDNKLSLSTPLPEDKVINGVVALQLFGYDSKFSEGKLGEMEKDIFKREGINFKHFYNKDYNTLSCKGDFRESIIFPRDLKLLSIEEDDLNQKDLPGSLKATVSFVLDKGQYATVLIRELIKLKHIG